MISLNIPEVDIQLDEQGNIVDARPADDSFTHTIIEMFMVEANDAVCRLLTQKRVPHLRRIHPPPEPKAAREFGRLISGVGLPAPANLDRGAIRTLLESVRGGPSETAVNLLLLRSLSQACYSPERIGHFALASEDYCHFTSPIRRYPDLVVHRALKSYLRGTQTARERGRRDAGEPDLVELARHTSATERVAQQAEREARKVLLLDLMKSKVGQTLDGTITGVTPAGVFVQVRPYLAEGLVRREDFGSGWWDFDRGRGAFIGQPNGRVIAIGQPVSVLVAAVHELHQELVLVPAVGTSLGVGSTEAAGKARGPAARVVGGSRSRTPRRGRRRTGGAKKRGHQGP
jgi:ribonuclease R